MRKPDPGNKVDGKVTKKLIDDAMDYCAKYKGEKYNNFSERCLQCPGNGRPEYHCGLWALACDEALTGIRSFEFPGVVGGSDTAKKFFYQLLDPMLLLIEEVEELDDQDGR
jgi:hypothetical protein